MKKSVLLFLLLLGCGIAPAQVSFGYDAAGNRISRTITLARSALVTKTDSVKPATEMLGDMQVKIYPNPTQGRLSVQVIGLPDGTSGTLGIFSLQGQLLLRGEASSSRTDLDISGQPVGTYILRINVGGKNTSWKIIKE
ncbi:MAG: hypothetical protein BGN96_11000 [Bacteroidales bacterium 45-6]|nr:MAG: hypothetical protein BGN96_11000 [Bacteroidales bacterium 45-6]